MSIWGSCTHSLKCQDLYLARELKANIEQKQREEEEDRTKRECHFIPQFFHLEKEEWKFIYEEEIFQNFTNADILLKDLIHNK